LLLPPNLPPEPAPGGLALNDTQWALFRAGHAHAGVWVILSLVVQVLLDAASLSSGSKWVARLRAPIAAVAISGGFFGAASVPAFRWLMYFGAGSLAVGVVLTGVGLLRSRRVTPNRANAAGNLASIR
jgi:hypothetical protein